MAWAGLASTSRWVSWWTCRTVRAVTLKWGAMTEAQPWTKYQYQRLPLTPSIAADLALELFAGKTEKRSVVAEAVGRAYSDRGGAPGEAEDLQRTLKEGLKRLRRDGLCERAGYAYWTFGPVKTDIPDTDIEPHERYQHEGLPLIPSIAAELALELFAGKTEKRSVVAEAVSRAHLDRGGAPPNAQDLQRVMKKALVRLRRDGLCENARYAHWTFGGSQVERSDVPDDGSASTDDSSFQLDTQQPPLSEDTPMVGQGDGFVYVYYLPAYAAMAASEGKKTWPCKVGRSSRDPVLRIMSQARTALPERPEIALVMRTNDSSALESALHSILRLRGRWRFDSPCSEWFDTSPAEVLSIYRLIEAAARDT